MKYLSLICIFALTYFAAVREELLQRGVSDFLYWGLFVLLGVVSILCLLLSRDLKGTEPLSKGALEKELREKIVEMVTLIEYSRQNINSFQEQMLTRPGTVSRLAGDTFSRVKKITIALQTRSDEIEKLLGSKERGRLEKAKELLDQDLRLEGNCYTSLLDSEPLEDIPAEELRVLLFQMFSDIESELQRVANYAYSNSSI